MSNVGTSTWYRPPTNVLLGVTTLVGVSFVGAAFAYLKDATQQAKLLVVIFVIISISVTAFRPIVGLALLLLLAPLNHLVTIIGLTVGTTDLLLLGVAGAAVIHSKPSLMRPSTLVSLGLIVLGAFLASVFAVEAPVALWGAIRWLAIAIVFVYASTIAISKSFLCKGLVILISVSGAVAAGFSILQWLGIYIFVGPPFLPDRIDSVFGYYTQFAGFMAIVFVISIAECIQRAQAKAWGPSTYFAISATLSAIGIALSLSRGGVLSVVVGSTVFVILSIRRIGTALSAVLIAGILIVGVPIALPSSIKTPFTDRFVDRAEVTAGGDQVRLRLQRSGRTALLEHPLGIGYGNFSRYLELHGQPPYFHTHRMILQMGLDAGWLGLVGFLGLVGAPVFSGASRFLRSGLQPRIAGFIAALCGLLAQTWFDYFFYETVWLIVFAYIIWAAGTSLSREEAIEGAA